MSAVERLFGGKTHQIIVEIPVPVVAHHVRQMNMRIDESRQQRRVTEINHPGIWRNLRLRAHGLYLGPSDDHDAVIHKLS